MRRSRKVVLWGARARDTQLTSIAHRQSAVRLMMSRSFDVSFQAAMDRLRAAATSSAYSMRRLVDALSEMTP